MLTVIRSYLLAWLHFDRNPHHPDCITRLGTGPGRICNCRGRGRSLVR